jgi:uncharacterized protein (DUF1697 family)
MAAVKRYVALLRAINLGPTTRVPMAELREALAELGCANVRTLLNSGNAVFDAAKGTPASLAKAIREAVAARTGVDTPVVVKTVAEIGEALQAHPLRDTADNDSRLLMLFTQDASRLDRVRELASTSWGTEVLAVGPQAAWLWCPDGIHQSKLARAADKALGGLGTARNRATMEKLAALAASLPA